MESTPLSVPEAIVRRRATRSFDASRPLDERLLKQILGLAVQAPSAFNLQPWRFIVIRSEANRKVLRGCAFNQPKVTEAPVMVIVLGALEPHESHAMPIVDAMVDRGVMGAPGASEYRARMTRSMANLADPALWATRSTMLAAATLMITSESLGVASAPMEGFDAGAVRQAFGVPDDHVVCCLIALGYATEIKPFPGRLGLEEVCFEEHFGQPWTLGEAS